MRTPLGLLNLVHGKVRSAVAVAGVTFSIALMFLQLGFYGSVRANAVKLFNHLRFDLLIRSREYLRVTRPGHFPRARLAQARALPGVVSAAPLYVEWVDWRNPDDRSQTGLLGLAFDPSDHPLDLPEVEAAADALRQEGAVLFDRASIPDYGPRRPGLVTEAGRRRVAVHGLYTLGMGFIANGTIVLSDQNLIRLRDRGSLDEVGLGLVRLRPGVDPVATARELRRRLPADVDVLTRPEAEDRERRYWVRSTSTGITFGSGVVVAFAVGLVIIYQVLSGEVTDHIKEFATLKAMGYGDAALGFVVLQQAAALVLVGFALGLAAALVLYRVVREAIRIPIAMDAGRVVLVLAASLAMCVASGWLAARTVQTADPADLF